MTALSLVSSPARRVVQLPPEIVAVLKEINEVSLRATGTPAYISGGFVRDYLLGISDYHDIDVGVPDAEAVFNLATLKFMPSGESKADFGVQSVFVAIGSGAPGRVDIVQLRLEAYRDDSRKPTIKPTTDISVDLSRRDFTCNAIAWVIVSFGHDSITVEEIDPYDGFGDIQRKVLKMVGNPRDRIYEDPLRIMRGVRFATKLGFEIDQPTWDAMVAESYRLADGPTAPVSRERVVDELSRTLVLPQRGRAVRLYFKPNTAGTFILEAVAPPFKGVNSIFHDSRPPHHAESIGEHLAETVERADPDLIDVLAALFHDIGKITQLVIREDGRHTFYHHEDVSAEIVSWWFPANKFPNDVSRIVRSLVAYHMRLHLVSKESDESKRKAMAKIFVTFHGDLDFLRRLIRLGEADSGMSYDYFRGLINEYSHVKLVSGNELLEVDPELLTTRENRQAIGRALWHIQKRQLAENLTYPKLDGVIKSNINDSKAFFARLKTKKGTEKAEVVAVQ